MSDFSQTQSKVLYIFIGILVPILAALIPYAYRYFMPEHDLNYRIVNTTKVLGFTAVELELLNNGEKVEKNTQVLIKKSFYPRNGTYNYLDTFAVDIEPKLKYKLSESEYYFVLNLGNIRPREKLDISFTSPDIENLLGLSSDIGGNVVTIKSDDNIARLVTPSEFLEFVNTAAFWVLLLIIFSVISIGIYLEYFQPVEEKKKRLKLTIESYTKQLDRLVDK